MLRRGGSRFLALDSSPRSLLVVSQVTVVASHWIAADRRSQRCGGRGCPICASGQEPIDRAYVWVQLGDGSNRILELRARQEEQLAAQGVTLEQVEGCELVVKRNGQAFNSPVEVEVVGRAPGRGLPGPEPGLLGLQPPAPELPGTKNSKVARVHPNDPLAGSAPEPSKRK